MKDIQRELLTQDNRITADPLFVVFQHERIATEYDPDDYVYVETDTGEYYEHDDLQSIYEANDEEMPDGADENDMQRRFDCIERRSYVERNEFVTACFTEKGAQDYIDANGHNLREPFIYAKSLYRNQEMIKVRECIMSNREWSASEPRPAVLIKSTVEDIISTWWNDGLRKVWREDLENPERRNKWLHELADMISASTSKFRILEDEI